MKRLYVLVFKELNPRRKVYVEIPKPARVELKCSLPRGQLTCGRYLSAAVKRMSQVPGRPISETLQVAFWRKFGHALESWYVGLPDLQQHSDL
jgi:hypothetical protein